MPQPITAVRTGTGWTLDVTALALNSNTGVQDYIAFVPPSRTPIVGFTKTSQVLLTYTGVALAASTTIRVYRNSPFTPDTFAYNEVNTSAGLNARFTQLARVTEDLQVMQTQVVYP